MLFDRGLILPPKPPYPWRTNLPLESPMLAHAAVSNCLAPEVRISALLQSSAYSSKFRILRPLCFHTLLKTAGAGGYSSHSETQRLCGLCARTLRFVLFCPFCPLLSRLFSSKYNNQTLQPFCFDNDANCPGGG